MYLVQVSYRYIDSSSTRILICFSLILFLNGVISLFGWYSFYNNTIIMCICIFVSFLTEIQTEIRRPEKMSLLIEIRRIFLDIPLRSEIIDTRNFRIVPKQKNWGLWEKLYIECSETNNTPIDDNREPCRYTISFTTVASARRYIREICEYTTDQEK